MLKPQWKEVWVGSTVHFHISKATLNQLCLYNNKKKIKKKVTSATVISENKFCIPYFDCQKGMVPDASINPNKLNALKLKCSALQKKGKEKNHIVMKSNKDYIHKVIQSPVNPTMIGLWRTCAHRHPRGRLKGIYQ